MTKQRPHKRRFSRKTGTFKAGRGNASTSFDFPKKRSKNRYHFTIFVPSTTAKDKPVSQNTFTKRLDETKKFASEKFEGTTTTTGKGTYTDNNGKLIQEKVGIVEVYTTPKKYKKYDTEIEEYLKKKKKKWKQESIGYSFESPNRPDEEIHFV